MTAVRGPYNKTSQRLPLTDEQLKATLKKRFVELHKTVPCPHCNERTVFRTRGKSKEPEYVCTVCNKYMHADVMFALVSCDPENDPQPPASDPLPTYVGSTLPDGIELDQ